MTYQLFLTKLLSIDTIDYGFCIKKSHSKKLIRLNRYDTLNSLAFAPIKYEEKKKIFNMLLDNKIHNSITLNGNLENVFDNFIVMYPMRKIAIENYIKYFYDWVDIVSNDDINKSTVKFIKKNICTDNNIFWLNLIKIFFENRKFQETLVLLKFIKKKYIKKDNILHNRLLSYELISLKKGYSYLDDKKIMNKICKIAKKDKYYEYERIITFFECALVDNDNISFEKLLKKYHPNILKWSILNVLNLFELAIYANETILVKKVEIILLQKDIMAYKDGKVNLIYSFLNAITEKNMTCIEFYKNKLKDYSEFDFMHYEWYIKQNNLGEK